MIKKATLASVTLTLLLAGLFMLYGTQKLATNCLFGGALSTSNLLLITWTIGKIFQKKSLALVSAVIVSKYAALIGLFVYLNLYGWRVDLGFVAGVATLLPAVLFMTVGHKKLGDENGSF